MIKILVVDDQKTVRESLKGLLNSVPDFQVVGTADNGRVALALVKQLHPDIVLIDMEMPEMDGIATTKIVRQQFTGVRVMILSMHDTDSYVAQAVKAGAMGYLLKNTPAYELEEAIRSVYRGYAQIGPGLIDKIITIAAEPVETNKGNTGNSTTALSKLNSQPKLTLKSKKRRYVAAWIVGNILLWSSSLLYLIFRPPSYISKWTLALPGTASSTSINLPEIGQASSQNQSPFSNLASDPRENYKLLAASDEVIERAAQNLQINVAEFDEPMVKILDNTTLMELSVRGSTPEEARVKALAVHRAFKESLQRLRAKESTEPDETTLQTIENAETRLEKARQELANYQASSGLNSPSQLQNLAGSIEQMRVDKAQLMTQQQRARGKAEQLRQELGLSAEQARLALSLHADSLFGQYLDNYNQIQTELVNLATRFLPSHPVVVAKQEDRQNAERALLQRASLILGQTASLSDLNNLGLKSQSNQYNSQKENLLRDFIDLQGEQTGLREQAQGLEQQIAQLENLQKQRSRIGSELNRLQKNAQIAEAVYSSALTELEINKNDTSNIYPPVSMMTQPSFPRKPSSPRVELVLLGSAVGSVLLTTALFSLWQRERRNFQYQVYTNGRVHDRALTDSAESLDILLKS